MCNVKGRNDGILDIFDKKSAPSTGSLRPPPRPPRGAAAQRIDFDPLRLPLQRLPAQLLPEQLEGHLHRAAERLARGALLRSIFEGYCEGRYGADINRDELACQTQNPNEVPSGNAGE